MASLIAPLACGIRGAEGGTAEIFQRGTSTAATVYSDWNCTVQETTHTLDGYGAVVRYVKEAVDVTVRDTTRSVQRTFTWSDSAAAVEVENVLVTGTTPSGQSGTGAGYRSTVDALFTSMFSSFGASDGKVLVNALPQNLKDVIGSSTNVFFNVKATYGADGDDSSDDTLAIQGAINACQSAGGGIVYFPPGTYKITGALSISNANVMLLAPTANTVLKNYAAAANWLSITASSVVVCGLGFTASTTGYTGNMINVGSSAKYIRIVGCQFNGSNAPAVIGGASDDSTTPNNVIDDCRFALTEASSTAVGTTPGAWQVTNSYVYITGSGGSVFKKSVTHLTNTRISAAGSASPLTILELGTGQPIAFTGCLIDNETTGEVDLLSDPSTPSSTTVVVESGNAVRNGTSGSVFISTGLKVFAGQRMVSQLRDSSRITTSNSATSYTPDTRYALHELTSSGASMAFANPTSGLAYPGARLTLWYKNTSGGNITPTFGTQFRATGVSVISNAAACWEFIYNGTSAAWDQVGAAVGYTP